MQPFKLKAEYNPAGDQPQAIEELVKGLNNKPSSQTLMGVTGSGKTYTIANVIQEIQKGYMMKDRLLRPSLVGVTKKREQKDKESKTNEKKSEKNDEKK